MKNARTYRLIGVLVVVVLVASLVACAKEQPHVHAFGEWVTEVAPTCTADGLAKRTCACGESKTKALSKTDHDYGDWTVAIRPTCAADGLQVRSCALCGKTQSQILQHGDEYHVWGDWTPNETSSCTVGEEYRVCTTCAAKETRQTEALGHAFGEWAQIAAPDCTQEGAERRVCSRCDEFEERTIPALGHLPVVDESVPADCTNSGLTEGSHCSRCGEVLVAQEPVEKLGHAFGAWIETSAPTCTQEGAERRTCSACGEHEERTVHAVDHVFGAWFVYTPAGCEEPGVERRTCAVCGAHQDKRIEPHGHLWQLAEFEWNGVEAVAKVVCGIDGAHQTELLPQQSQEVIETPTCTQRGQTKYKATIFLNGTAYWSEKTVDVDPLGHDYGEWAQIDPPTCTQQGSERRYCTRCDEYEEREVDAPGHLVVVDEAVPADCTNSGLTEGSHCSRCGEVFVAQEVVEKWGHAFDEWVTTQPTCVAEGVRQRTCSVCGEVERETIAIDSTRHEFGDWVEQTPAGCTVEGQDKRTCALCGKVEDRTVSALGHSVVADEAIPADCTDSGLTEGSHCSRCGEVFVAQEVVEALGHDFDEEGECTRCDFAQYMIPLEGFAFELNEAGDGYVLTGKGTVDESTQYVGIPSEYNGLPVVEIGYAALQNAGIGDGGFVKVFVPASVKTISGAAFSNARNLKQIILSEGLETIYSESFAWTALKSLSIPASVTKIWWNLTPNCNNLTSITVDEGNPAYASVNNCVIDMANKELVFGCKTSVIPTDGSVTSIGIRAFNCVQIESVTIPSSVTTIRSNAFLDDTVIESLVIPDSVVTIEGTYVFAGCKNLTEITIPLGVTQFGRGTFQNDLHLVAIHFGGTRAQWEAIAKGSDWNSGTGDYTVYCTDGEIAKS